ncbi:serine-rich protein-related protein [Artemisia annua]|uniref:Serine-rich protein-related protein n=1 Tax=Artemisia annua TaxID=35608 RepID=A0A2U1NK60_ARTAN|nr:serine-rich protein-related protein [Artemisia annua]
MAYTTRRNNGPVLRSNAPATSHRSSFASVTSATSSNTFFNTRSVTTSSSSPSSSSSVRFSFDNNRSISPSRSISSIPVAKQLETPKRTCMCSPTSHPGSFRCSLHKKQQTNSSSGTTNSSIVNSNSQTASYPSSRLNARRSAMTNSLVRIGTVEGGDLVKRALAALIRPSSHQQRRRGSFQARPSRLSVMSKDEDVFA